MAVMLAFLKTVRKARGINPTQLATLSGLSLARIKALENISIMQEPWLDEACCLSRVLNTRGILPLASLSGNLTDLDTGFSIPGDDVTAWRAGLRLSLSAACRLTAQFGLSDPADLVTVDLHRQIWDIVERNERGAEPGCCPWCLADIHAGHAHAATCLPDNLWGRRDLVDPATVSHIPRPQGGTARRAPSAIAHGLKAARERAMKTQKQLADAVDMHSNHFARIERGEVRLMRTTADKIAQLLRVTVESLYAQPEDA